MATKSTTKKRKAAVPAEASSKKPKTASKSKAPEKASKTRISKRSADQEDATADDEPQQDLAALFKGFGSGDKGDASSSDDDEDDAPAGNEIPLDLSLLPNPKSSTQKDIAAGEGAAAKKADAPRVLYMSRIPHGFHEPQMRSYFSQFGELTHVRLARNRRTGASRHFGFLQFEAAEVADIVARTMNNYLLFGHLLKCRVLGWDEVKRLGGVDGLFKGTGRRWKKIPWNAIERARVSRTDRDGWNKRILNEQKRRRGKMDRLKELGYEFHAPELKAVESVPVKAAIEGTGEVESQAVENIGVDESEPREQIEAVPAADTSEGTQAVKTSKTKRKSSKK